MGQKGKFFSKPEAKESLWGPRRRRADDRLSVAPERVCSHVCARKESRLIPALGWGWGFSLVNEDGRKATYSELVSWCTGGFCVEGVSQLEYPSQVCKGTSSASSCPRPNSWKCTQILSNIEKPHFGCADKKIIVKELCLYDDIAPVGKNREGKECHRPRSPVHRWCPCGCPGLGTWSPRASAWAITVLVQSLVWWCT